MVGKDDDKVGLWICLYCDWRKCICMYKTFAQQHLSRHGKVWI